MTVQLSSSDAVLDEALRQIGRDGKVSALEQQRLRDAADDAFLAALGAMPANDEASRACRRDLMQLMASADDMAEAIRQVALQAKRQTLAAVVRKDLQSFVEHQVAYAVGGYNASFQRL